MAQLLGKNDYSRHSVNYNDQLYESLKYSPHIPIYIYNYYMEERNLEQTDHYNSYLYHMESRMYPYLLYNDNMGQVLTYKTSFNKIKKMV